MVVAERPAKEDIGVRVEGTNEQNDKEAEGPVAATVQAVPDERRRMCMFEEEQPPSKCDSHE